MAEQIYKISEKYTDSPGGRNITEGPFSGEDFRKKVLEPFFQTKKDGDKLILKGINKTKKIKDIFIDEKIPITERKNWPIVTDDNDEIIWLPGLKKTKFDREKDQNYDIIIRYQKKGSL